jgi:hypothetical protein
MEEKELLKTQVRYEREKDGHPITMMKLSPKQMRRLGLRFPGERPQPSNLEGIGKILKENAEQASKLSAKDAEIAALRAQLAGNTEPDNKKLLAKISKAKTPDEVDKLTGESSDLEIIEAGEKRKSELV